VLSSASFVAHADMSACSSAYVKKDQDEAIALYTRCITGGDMSKGNLAGALTNRAVLYLEKGESDKAFSDLNTAIRLYPRAGMAFYNRAQIYLRRGDTRAAYDDLTSTIKFAPGRVHATAYAQRAYLSAGRGDCAAAAKDAKEAVARSPKDPDLQAMRARILTTCQEGRVSDENAGGNADR
jgi:tetratricopeptide (TPR) repeat protein